mmetsp:Transcript_57095/g.184896  ORF Transcript_57095/g.184896 Transcript_57095/m.184896 type:complete len:87 (+) Transcript_57095:1069-1329(+)
MKLNAYEFKINIIDNDLLHPSVSSDLIRRRAGSPIISTPQCARRCVVCTGGYPHSARLVFYSWDVAAAAAAAAAASAAAAAAQAVF